MVTGVVILAVEAIVSKRIVFKTSFDWIVGRGLVTMKE
jgi:hypothetical protein